MKEFYTHKYPPTIVNKLIQFKYNISADDGDICLKNILYRADVTFSLATNTLPVTVMSRRLSPFDKLSAFGWLNILTICNNLN